LCGDVASMSRTPKTKVLATLPTGTVNRDDIQLADCEVFHDATVQHRGRVLVPSNFNLRQSLRQLRHANRVSGHAGRHVTHWHLSQSFYWPPIASDLADFLQQCNTCKRGKASRQPKTRLSFVPCQYPTTFGPTELAGPVTAGDIAGFRCV
jgi:hypothetical protein